MNLLFNSDIKNLLLKTEGLMLLFWSALIVDVRMVRLGRWERWEGGEVGKGGTVLAWEGGRFLVLFKGGGRRVALKFHLFVFDVNQGNKEAGWNCHWNCMYLFEGL